MKLHKTTKTSQTYEKRMYMDACGTAHALHLLGERWAILIIRELMFGPKRFGELRAGLPGISANILIQRLEGLEASGILVRRKLPPPASIQVYELTQWGYETEPIMQSLGRWAVRSPDHDPTLPFSSASAMMSFRTMLDADLAGDLDRRFGFRFGEESFVGHLHHGRFDVSRADTAGADAIFVTEPAFLAAAVYGGQSFAALESTGKFRIEGDRALAERFTKLFPLPEKVTLPAPVTD